jgi:hypothetical protein
MNGLTREISYLNPMELPTGAKNSIVLSKFTKYPVNKKSSHRKTAIHQVTRHAHKNAAN